MNENMMMKAVFSKAVATAEVIVAGVGLSIAATCGSVTGVAEGETTHIAHMIAVSALIVGAAVARFEHEDLAKKELKGES